MSWVDMLSLGLKCPIPWPELLPWTIAVPMGRRGPVFMLTVP